MKTEIKKIGDTIVVSVDGKLDFETNVPFREELNRLLRQTRRDDIPRKIVFDLDKLDFVGSSGISAFVQTLKDFNATVNTKPRYCNVKSEFRRIIQAFDESGLFEFYDNQDRAKKSFDQ